MREMSLLRVRSVIKYVIMGCSRGAWLPCQYWLWPSSDIVLLPCRAKLELGSAKELQKHDFDSDVVPVSYQISGCTEAIKQVSSKYINIIYEFCLAQQKHHLCIAVVSESCSTTKFAMLNCFAMLN